MWQYSSLVLHWPSAILQPKFAAGSFAFIQEITFLSNVISGSPLLHRTLCRVFSLMMGWAWWKYGVRVNCLPRKQMWLMVYLTVLSSKPIEKPQELRRRYFSRSMHIHSCIPSANAGICLVFRSESAMSNRSSWSSRSALARVDRKLCSNSIESSI